MWLRQVHFFKRWKCWFPAFFILMYNVWGGLYINGSVHKLFTQIVLQNPTRFFIIDNRSKCVPVYGKCFKNSFNNKGKQGEEIWKKRQ